MTRPRGLRAWIGGSGIFFYESQPMAVRVIFCERRRHLLVTNMTTGEEVNRIKLLSYNGYAYHFGSNGVFMSSSYFGGTGYLLWALPDLIM